MLGEGGILSCGWYIGRGNETRLANHFGVHRSTICRDVAALQAEYRKEHVCLLCREMFSIPLKTLTRLAKRGLWDGCTLESCEKVRRVADRHKAALNQSVTENAGME